ncbi:hypothetical protein PtA15_4A560 [Puccinia triticina]|uniref:Pre-mRNA-processing protein 45 n=1 Tax=Puccinia triticina TaxID=208348 RepID=A0ABY7CG81_9BASI|nr:uncharacterized protein PtA15_4A560 [Puccinia triticina]WAQ84109.1 hypothetical protein PtA15_4A560 [Puccinia triticina]
MTLDRPADANLDQLAPASQVIKPNNQDGHPPPGTPSSNPPNHHLDDRHVQAQLNELAPLAHRVDPDDSAWEMERGSAKQVQATTDRTRMALEKQNNIRIKAAQPKHVSETSRNLSFVRYTSNGEEGKQRIIKMVETTRSSNNSGYAEAQLIAPMTLLIEFLSTAGFENRFAYNKYANRKFHSASVFARNQALKRGHEEAGHEIHEII